MPKFSIALNIQAPPDRVWAVLTDVERWPEWTPSMNSVQLLDPGPLHVGTRALIRQPKLPPAVWKVTWLVPGKSFTWVAGGPTARVLARHAVEPGNGGSRVTLSVHFSGMIGGLMARLTRGINERYLELEAKGLKRRCEAA